MQRLRRSHTSISKVLFRMRSQAASVKMRCERIIKVNGDGLVMVDAKEIKVADIIPPGFIIEILDAEQKPLAGVGFSYAVDDGDTKFQDTDEEGILKVPKPKSSITLSLAGGEVSTSSEEHAKPDEKESETPEPIQSQEEQEEALSTADSS